ncbi:helix-turn-helix domain-containing protein [Cryptosporangium aurantiacum]|uniref:Helix-turn-helix domain-containing protein n=1 Tax=Cryptosporangium aurantiacum TaxID=134849 RepID=A0A1M7PU85_9ACTN|nr:helix-turn-helix transcriptional regulator [Cryptosporangium aurantiacum]SHN21006.1 Helix-turn-helix domain-containing protein [Cryptosporangium aurantiacum]
MRTTYGATVAKRRLARRLVELRVENGYTANQVCDKLNWGRGKVGRFEANVWKRPEMSDVRDLLRIYGVPDADREDLEALAMLARGRSWWREYSDVFEDGEYAGFESDAVRISLYMPLILPGLLQTTAYTEAHMHVGTKSAQWRARALEARQRRQQVLEPSDDGPGVELVAVLTEASLLYHWGTQEQRRAQITHLVAMSQRPNVEIRLLRFADGPHPGMSSLISIFDFPGDEPGIVYLENDAAVQQLDAVADVEVYKKIFAEIRSAALEPGATTEYLEKLADTLD